MNEEAQYLHTRALGLGLLHWGDHVKALKVKALLDYRDGSRGAWKDVLDQWIAANFNEGRGILLANVRDKPGSFLLQPGGHPLPEFWMSAIMALEELQPTLRAKDTISPDAARAEPFWYSHLFTVPTDLQRYKHLAGSQRWTSAR